MTEKKIKLNATNEVQEFVNAASECNFDINLHYQRAIVDAKSFLGVLSLGLSKIFTVSYGGNDGNFEQILRSNWPGRNSTLNAFAPFRSKVSS